MKGFDVRGIKFCIGIAVYQLEQQLDKSIKVKGR